MSPLLKTLGWRTRLSVSLGMVLCFAIPFMTVQPAAAHSMRTNHPQARVTTRAMVIRSSSVHSPRHTLLELINSGRAKRDLKALQLNKKQSGCAKKHSREMAAAHQIFHGSSDICIAYRTSGENVGEASSTSKLAALKLINKMMRAEGPCPSACPTGTAEWAAHGHYLNLVNPAYRKIGIGVAVTGTAVYVTEDFVG